MEFRYFLGYRLVGEKPRKVRILEDIYCRPVIIEDTSCILAIWIPAPVEEISYSFWQKIIDESILPENILTGICSTKLTYDDRIPTDKASKLLLPDRSHIRRKWYIREVCMRPNIGSIYMRRKDESMWWDDEWIEWRTVDGFDVSASSCRIRTFTISIIEVYSFHHNQEIRIDRKYCLSSLFCKMFPIFIAVSCSPTSDSCRFIFEVNTDNKGVIFISFCDKCEVMKPILFEVPSCHR